MTTFGTPKLVTLTNLATKKKLAMADIAKVKENLTNQGYYLQLPPPVENRSTLRSPVGDRCHTSSTGC